MPRKIIASSPWHKGPMELPWRIVLVMWLDGEGKPVQFSVHRQFDHDGGSLGSGDYFSPGMRRDPAALNEAYTNAGRQFGRDVLNAVDRGYFHLPFLCELAKEPPCEPATASSPM